jgi:hypothetical protein
MCLALAAPAHAAEEARMAGAKAEKPAATKSAGEDIVKKILERGRPAEKDHTAVLMPLAGTWDYSGSFWTDSKDAHPATGFVTSDMILDGHYLSSKGSGTLNIGRELLPFENMELIGFDNAKKSLSFAAVDTLTTGMMVGSGKLEEKERAAPAPGLVTDGSLPGTKERVIRETGRFTNPATGSEQGFRAEIRLVDSEHYKRTVWAVDKSGKETKLSEMDYTRRK